jgi:hypothetical protein
MKAILYLCAVAALFLAPSPCFALWGIAPVTKERATEQGMEIRAKAAGPNAVRVELEFKLAGELKNFHRVDLRFGDGGQSVLTAPLREDRPQPDRVVVSFNADRTRLDEIKLWVMVPYPLGLGGTAYEIRVKDFVELEPIR